jgi:hypothetical protein
MIVLTSSVGLKTRNYYYIIRVEEYDKIGVIFRLKEFDQAPFTFRVKD